MSLLDYLQNNVFSREQGILYDFTVKHLSLQLGLLTPERRFHVVSVWENGTKTVLKKRSVELDLSDVDDTIYQCRSCGSRKIDMYQLKTRGADEPMTSFFTCLACRKRWRQ